VDDEEEEEHVEGPPSWLWRWLLVTALLGGAVPVILTAVVYIAVAGFTLRDEFGMAIPFIFGGLALIIGVPTGVFAIAYLLLRSYWMRRTFYAFGATIWTLSPALLSWKEDLALPETLLLLLVFMMLGTGVSALFVRIVDGRGPSIRPETAEIAM